MNKTHAYLLAACLFLVPLGCGGGSAPTVELERVTPTDTETKKALGFSIQVPKGAKQIDCGSNANFGITCFYRYLFDAAKPNDPSNQYKVRVTKPKQPLGSREQAQLYAVKRAFGLQIITKKRRLSDGGLLVEFGEGRSFVKVFRFYKQAKSFVAVECTGPSAKHMDNLRRMCGSFKAVDSVAKK